MASFSVTNFFVSLIQLLVPQPCFDKFFVELNFLDVPCLKVVISKGLGYAIILGSVLVKVPQVVKMMAAKSGEGISMTSVLLEIFSLTAVTAYGWAKSFPFSAYGEGIFLIIQTVNIAFLVLWYGNKESSAITFFIGYSAIFSYLMSPLVPLVVLSSMQAICLPITIASKLTQVFANYQNSSTGQLSAITLALLFAGSFARILTSIQETGDSLIIAQYSASTVCNALLVAQLIYYWTPKEKVKEQ